MSLRIPEFGPTTLWGTKTDRGMIWLILGFFLQAFCSLPYLNTSLVESSTKGQAWFSFILEPWHVFNQVNPEPHEKLHNLHCCAPDVSEDLWQKCAYSKITVTPLPPSPTFALSAAIQMWIGKNTPGRAKKRQRGKCWKMRCKEEVCCRLGSAPDSLGRYRVGLICDYSELI